MPYIAGQRLTINGEYREGGEPVPEAETEHWRTINDLVAVGHLVWVDEPAATETAPEPTPVVYHPPVPEPTEPGPQDEAVVAAQEATETAAAKERAATVVAEPPPKPKPRPTTRKRSHR